MFEIKFSKNKRENVIVNRKGFLKLQVFYQDPYNGIVVHIGLDAEGWLLVAIEEIGRVNES